MKTTLIFASSINWFIAESTDETNWSTAEWQAYEADINRVGNLIMGKRTYDIMAYGGYLDSLGMRHIVILSHESIETPHKVVTSPEEAIAYLESVWETEAIIAGGADIASQFLDRWLTSEIILDIEPVIINSWIPIFRNIEHLPTLKLLDMKKLGEDTIRAHYQVN